MVSWEWGEKEGEARQVAYYRIRGKTGELGLEDKKDSEDGSLTYWLPWPSDLQVQSTSGYWQLRERDGIREGGWVLSEFSESPENGGREERQPLEAFGF